MNRQNQWVFPLKMRNVDGFCETVAGSGRSAYRCEWWMNGQGLPDKSVGWVNEWVSEFL